MDLNINSLAAKYLLNTNEADIDTIENSFDNADYTNIFLNLKSLIFTTNNNNISKEAFHKIMNKTSGKDDVEISDNNPSSEETDSFITFQKNDLFNEAGISFFYPQFRIQ